MSLLDILARLTEPKPGPCPKCGSRKIFVARSWYIGGANLPPSEQLDLGLIDRDAECACGHSWPLKPVSR